MKKRQLIAGFSLIDPETGVVRDSQRTHDYPEKVGQEGDRFCQIELANQS